MLNLNYNEFGPKLFQVAIGAFSVLMLGGLIADDISAQNESKSATKSSNQMGVNAASGQNSTSVPGANSQNDSALIVTTDRTVYSPGEIVNITISNTGEIPLTFPNSALGLNIRSMQTNVTYPIFSAQVISTLNPNDSRSVIWDQIGSNGTQVPPGDYIASVGSGSAEDEVIFNIS
jgi:hypothetical protein